MTWVAPVLIDIPKPKPQRSPYSGKPDRNQTRAINARILALASRGFKDYQIADKLHLSRQTVSRHRRGKIKAAQ